MKISKEKLKMVAYIERGVQFEAGGSAAQLLVLAYIKGRAVQQEELERPPENLGRHPERRLVYWKCPCL